MAVTDPALPSTRVGTKTPSAQASEDTASNASAVTTRLAATPETRVTSFAPKLRSPLAADADGNHALGEVRVPPLIRPYEVEPLVLVGQIRSVHEHLGVLGELV